MKSVHLIFLLYIFVLLVSSLWKVLDYPYILWGYPSVWLYEHLSIEGETGEYVILWIGLARNILFWFVILAAAILGFHVIQRLLLRR